MGLFGFDFNGDGEVSPMESAMTMAILDQMMRENESDDDDDDDDDF